MTIKKGSIIRILPLILGFALIGASLAYAQAGGNGVASGTSETPVGPVVKNRPPAPTGHTVKNAYPEGFLTLSEPSTISNPAEDVQLTRKVREAAGPQTSHLLFILGAITAVGLFMAVAWIDHSYRVRLQSIISQNNRLLNGEDVDLINEAPVVGIPLFLGTQEAVGSDFGAGLNEYLAETADDLTKPGATA